MVDKGEFLPIISNNIRKMRGNKGWSQEALANEADLSRSSIQRIEREEHSPSIETLEKISKALGVTLFDLLKK